MWSGIECSVAIVCASIPSLAPFFALYFPKLLGSSLTGSRGKLYNYSGSSRRSEGYTLESVKTDQPYSNPANQTHVKTTVIRRENESEESIIPGAVKTSAA